MEAILYTVLHTDTTVLGLVGDRITPNRMRQGDSLPAITFQQISGIRGYTQDGPDTLVDARYQINCIASTYAGSRTLADAVRDALSNYHDVEDGDTVWYCYLEDEGDLPSLEPEAEQRHIYVKRLDFKIGFKET